MEPIITSMLDTDQYKPSMGNLVCKLYPRAVAKYQFINRGNTSFPPGFATLLREQIESMSDIQLDPEEKKFLQTKCPYLDPVFLDFLMGFRFDPNEVKISQNNEHLNLTIEGPWYRTIYLEVPLMAIISELYFATAHNIEMLKDHIDSPIEVKNEARRKCHRMSESGAKLAEFGTRRRYSRLIHERVIEGLIEGGDALVGTSNLHFAMKFGLTPIGTMAHELIQAVSALKGLRHANAFAMEDWVSVYQGNLGIMLPDTFGSKAFFEDFNTKFACLFQGTRQDSGDAFDYGEKAIKHYEHLRIEPPSKTIVFSNGLDIDESLRIHNHFHSRIKTSFGIGTDLTNSIGFKPLNMVIKLVEINGMPVVKLSDSPGKETGDPKAIEYTKWIFGIN